MTLLLVSILFSVVAIACAIKSMHHAREARRHADAAESLRCARFVWPTATMGDDGVIRVNMAEEDKLRAEFQCFDAVRREAFGQTMRARR